MAIASTPLAFERVGERRDRRLVERQPHAALGVHALGHGEAQRRAAPAARGFSMKMSYCSKRFSCAISIEVAEALRW